MKSIFIDHMICIICGKEFIKTGRNQFCCSGECSKINKKEYDKKQYQENKEQIKKQLKEYKKEKKEYDKKYREEHKEKIKEESKEYYQEHKEKINKQHKEYNQEYKEEIKEYHQEYYQENKDEVRKYQQEHKNEKKEYNKEYYQENKEKILKYAKQYLQTLIGKNVNKRHVNKRNRNLGFNPLNNWFEGSEAHHIDKINVIYIPKELHRSIWHSVLNNINMNEINQLAWTFLESNSY